MDSEEESKNKESAALPTPRRETLNRKLRISRRNVRDPHRDYEKSYCTRSESSEITESWIKYGAGSGVSVRQSTGSTSPILASDR